MPDKPKTIVYLRPDTIGDLVLFIPALRLFMAQWPDARHVIVVRSGYEEVASLFPAKAEWKIARFNPFRQRPADCRGELSALFAEIASLDPDLVLAPTLNRTWLELAVAAHFDKVRSVVLGSAEVDPNFSASLRLDLGIDAATAFKEIVPSDAASGDVENQHRFAEKIIGSSLKRDLPSISVPQSATDAARAVLNKLGLKTSQWAAVFVGGLANVPVKSWNPGKFGEVVDWLTKTRKIPVLIMAHSSESSFAEDVVSRAQALTGTRPLLWLGKDGELSLLAAILADSAFYVGHDTGAMHIAGAVGRPVAGIFGGGHWPRFRPSAFQAISVVQPLPCFGCNWDCHFGDGPCVKTIDSADVNRAIGMILDEGSGPIDTIVESHGLPEESVRLIAASTPEILALKRDRIDRQHKIEELKNETDSKDVEIEDLKRAAEERKVEMESIKAELEQECADKDKEIAELKAETNSKDVEIGDLKRAAEERKVEMESIKAELEQECADKDKEIAELKAESDTKDTEIDALKVSCDERQEIVVRLDAGLKAHIAAAGAREQQIAALEADRNILKERLALLSTLPPDAEAIATLVRHKDVHIGNLDAVVHNREERIRILEGEIANYAGGYAGTEQAKHYGRLLAEKEAMIQQLHKSCVERGDVIEELVAASTTSTAELRKIWIGLRTMFKEKVSRPVGRLFSRKVADKHWMQIGVLRQYEPRPIVWDPRLAKAPPVTDSSPTIGIVTPSYGQAAFLESTILSVLNQAYPKLLYVVQDGGSRDASPQIIARYAPRLSHGVSEPDKGQADAVRRGFAKIEGKLGPMDVMAYLNSDDFLAPRALARVAAYFEAHPDIDVVYGHRIIIDDADQEIGRWIMPTHEADSIEWIDYVPQETLFWRKRAWDLAGGIDPSFQFALDWDLLARFHKAGLRIVRIPYFLGCFRVHSQQKTSSVIHTTGSDEMARIRLRFHGTDRDDEGMIEKHAQRIRKRGAMAARFHALGIRW